MKTISFNQAQKEILIKYLNKRLIDWKDSFINTKGSLEKRLGKSYINPVVNAIDKISKYDSFSLTNHEKIECISCVNEHYDELYKLMDLPTFMSWLTISEEQRDVIEKLDNCNDILLKCGYFNKKEYFNEYNKTFRYQNVLDTIGKLRGAKNVFLSKTGESNYYKIAFICENNHYVPFELKSSISWREIEFRKFGTDKPEDYVPSKFSLLTTKQKAFELIESCDKQNYPEGVLEIMKNLLS
jgi:hypothetical protein